MANKAETLNAMFCNPRRDEDAFWRAVTSYVSIVVRWMVRDQSSYCADDIVQNVAMQVSKKIGSLTIHPGSTFVKWLKVVIKNEVYSHWRDEKQNREIPFSQMPLTRGEDGELVPLEAEDFPGGVVQFVEEIDEDANEERFTREEAITNRLNDFAETLSDSDKMIFAMLREGVGVRLIGKRLGIPPSTVGGKVKAWRHKADRMTQNEEGVLATPGLVGLLKSKDDILLYNLLRKGIKPNEATRLCGKTKQWAYNRIVSWERLAKRSSLAVTRLAA
jgi:RNA polymerase sigma factor (sigma-70 family)